MEVFYGLFTACEVAYYSYIYAKVDRTHYQEVTGYTRSAYLLGRSVSGIISQTLIWTGFSYLSLNVVTLGSKSNLTSLVDIFTYWLVILFHQFEVKAPAMSPRTRNPQLSYE